MKIVTSPYVGINDWLNQNPNLYISKAFNTQELIAQTLKALNNSFHKVEVNISVLESWKNALQNL